MICKEGLTVTTHPRSDSLDEIERLFIAVKTDQSCKTVPVNIKPSKWIRGGTIAEHLAVWKDTPCANFEIPSCEKELAGFEKSLVLYMKGEDSYTNSRGEESAHLMNFFPSRIAELTIPKPEFSPIVTLSKCCKGKSVVQKGGGSGGEGGEPLPLL